MTQMRPMLPHLSRRHAPLAALFSLATLLAVPASAQEAADPTADERARTHFDSGRLHYEEGDYESALREFRSAYELSHRDALLYNLYLVEERLGHLEDAAAHLEQYLASGTATAEERGVLERRLANLRERIAARETEPEAPVAAPVAPEREHPLVIPGWIAVGVGGASLVTFGILGGLALSEDSSLASGCGSTGTCTDDELSGLRGLILGADITLTIGVVAAAAGVTLLVIDAVTGGSERAPDRARIAPILSPTTAGLFIEGAL